MKFVGTATPPAGGRLHPQRLAEIIEEQCPNLQVDWRWEHRTSVVTAEGSADESEIQDAVRIAKESGYQPL